MSNDDLTVYEVGRRLDDLKESVTKVAEKVDNLTEVHASLASHAARLDGHDIELRDLKTANVNAETVRNGRVTARTAVIASSASVASTVIALVSYHFTK